MQLNGWKEELSQFIPSSSLVFAGVSRLLSNQVSRGLGGAVYAIGSTVTVYDQVIASNNKALSSGGSRFLSYAE